MRAILGGAYTYAVMAISSSKKLTITISIIIVLALGGFVAAWLLDRDGDKVVETQDTVTTVTDRTSEPEEPAFDKQQFSLSDPTSIWIVSNKQRPLDPRDYAPSDLVSVGNGQRLRSEAASALTELFDAASSAGYTLRPLSGYRSYSTQVAVYQSEVNAYGRAVADTQSARPGTSEHQTGLAIDIGGGGCGIEDCFGDTEEGKWVAANAYKYGFIIRYPEGKQNVTGYRYEPWHVRYVGKDLSIEMNRQGILTLEEFFGLPAAPDYQ